MPPQLEVLVTHTDVRLESVLPTIEIDLRITNRAGEPLGLAIIYYEVYLSKEHPAPSSTHTLARGDRFLASGTFAVDNIPLGQSKSAKIYIPLTIDLNNAIYEDLLVLKRDELVFKIALSGTYLYRSSGGTPFNISPITFYIAEGSRATTSTSCVLTARLSVDKWRKAVSAFYRDITWIAVSRETFRKLKEILDEKGYVSYDEVIKELLKASERKG